MEEIKTTCLHDRHVGLGAQMVPFGGFDMPLIYTDIAEEHNAVRQGCGVFDVSHMGEVRVTGPEAQKFVNFIFSNDVIPGKAGQCFYGMMLHPWGGVVDDLLVYKYNEEHFLLVINAANIDKDWEWIRRNAARFNVKVENLSPVTGELAIQGPEAEKVVTEVLGIPCNDIEFYNFAERELPNGHKVLISRTGYTGEDGFEIYSPFEDTVAIWDTLMASKRVAPCGLGCRDTLRFEVGLPLYGDELTDEITPVEAGLSMFVKLDKPEGFNGRDAIAKQKAEGAKRKVVGLELADKAIPRHGYEVLSPEGDVIGEVTTGYRSISTGKSVAMALIDAKYAKLGTQLQIKIHRKVLPCTVVKKKFYDKHYKKD